jgi:YVTN family beta-propeller protein
MIMKSDISMRRPSFLARGYAALSAALALALGVDVRPAEASPFAYVTNTPSNTVSVIDTATNNVVATVPVGNGPFGVAVTPDGKRAYVANIGFSAFSNTVSVIDTATNTVVATVTVGFQPIGVAITPDGTRAYVTNNADGTVSVIDTASNLVTGSPIPVGANPIGLAITPNGKHAYLANAGSGTVSVIDTAINVVVATVAVGSNPAAVAIIPDGKYAYVANAGSGTVSVIDTATNTVAINVPLGSIPEGVAVTPDGKNVYVVNFSSNNVSVIATATNTVVATVGVGNQPRAVGIIPPQLGIPFSVFTAKLEVQTGHKPNTHHFNLNASFTLGSASNGINPPTEPVTLKVGTFTTTIPPGSFKIADDHQEEGVGMKRFGPFRFDGVIDGVDLRVLIRPTGAKRYALEAEARHADLTGIKNPVPVTLIIGGDSGTVLVKAHINQKRAGRDDD